MSTSFRRLRRRLRVRYRLLTAGGSWAAQLPKTTQNNLRSFFFDGLFTSASDWIIVTYLPLFILALGASSSQIGLLTSLASLSAAAVLIPGAMLVDKIGNRKRIVLFSWEIASRVCLLLMAILPFFLRGPSAILVAIGIKVVMDGLKNFAMPAWVSLSADIVPLSWRGRYFATRNFIMSLSGMVMIYISGQVVTWIGEPKGYQWILGIAFLLGLISANSFARIRDYNRENTPVRAQRYSPKSLLLTLKTDRNFLAFCLFTALWTMAINIAAPFFNVFLVKDLSATASLIGVVSIVGRLSSLPSQRFLGQLADRWGSRKLMRIMALMIPFLPIYWFFIQKPWQAIPINIVGGILWAGMNLASFNFLLEISPREQGARYSALYHLSIAISTAIGASLGGFFADHWGTRIVFVLSGIGRLLAGLLLTKYVFDPGTKPGSEPSTHENEANP